MNFFKKLSKAGSLTIPQQIRHELNIPKGSAVEVEVQEDSVIIRKHVPTCLVCGTADNVKVVNGIEICTVCANAFKEGDSNGNDNEG